jgi:hypothetical protein
MSTSDRIMWGSLAAMAAGILNVAEHMAFRWSPEGAALPKILFILVLLLLAAAMVGFHALQRERYGRLGLLAFIMTVVGTLGIAVFVAIELAGGAVPAAIDDATFLMVAVGLILYGVATIRARVLPRWTGAGFMIGLPVWVILSIALGDIGEIIGAAVFGLIWVALGY